MDAMLDAAERLRPETTADEAAEIIGEQAGTTGDDRSAATLNLHESFACQNSECSAHGRTADP
jgi:hypothetical protein